VPQQLRGLVARAPYFAGGPAAPMRDIVDFYDRRYSIRYTEAEKLDLVNFLNPRSSASRQIPPFSATCRPDLL
jgi:hypothetical protein